MTDDRKAAIGRPPLPPEEVRKQFPLRLRMKYHARLRLLGVADWMEPLLELDLPPEVWARLLRMQPLRLRRGLERLANPPRRKPATVKEEI